MCAFQRARNLLPLLARVAAGGFTPRELETAIEELLHQKYMKIRMRWRVCARHAKPSGFRDGRGAKAGYFPDCGNKTLLEILSLAEGLADDAGRTSSFAACGSEKRAEFFFAKANGLRNLAVIGCKSLAGPAQRTLIRQGGRNFQAGVQVNLKDSSIRPIRATIRWYIRGDIVKVSRAGIVYVVVR